MGMCACVVHTVVLPLPNLNFCAPGVLTTFSPREFKNFSISISVCSPTRGLYDAFVIVVVAAAAAAAAAVAVAVAVAVVVVACYAYALFF